MLYKRYIVLFLAIILHNIALKSQEINGKCFEGYSLEDISDYTLDRVRKINRNLYLSNTGICKLYKNSWLLDSLGSKWGLDFYLPFPEKYSNSNIHIFNIGLAHNNEWDKKKPDPEFICIRIGRLKKGSFLKLRFNYATTSWQNSSKIKGFQPVILLNNKPSLRGAKIFGVLSNAKDEKWYSDSLEIKLSKNQKNSWLIIHPGKDGLAGLIMINCLSNEQIDEINEFYSENKDASFKKEIDFYNTREYYRHYEETLIKNKKIVLTEINFNTNDYTIKESNIPSLDSLSKFLNSFLYYKIKIIGYTDDIGNDKDNKELSKKRALSVYQYLVKKGVSPKRLQFEGKGKESPLFTNINDLNRAKNRRIEINLVN